MVLSTLVSAVTNTPPITRYISCCIVFIMTLVHIQFVTPYKLMYNKYLLARLEIWRVITSVLYFGDPSIDAVIHISFLYRYSKMLEEGFSTTSDYMYLIVIIWCMILAIASIFNITILSTAFSSTITYIWTRRNPHVIVQMLGFVNFPAFYLPFVVPGLSLLSQGKVVKEDFIGIIVGHVYFFFKDVYPKWGQDVLKTPCFIKKLFNEHSNNCCVRKMNVVAKNSSSDTRIDTENVESKHLEQTDEQVANANTTIDGNNLFVDNSAILDDSNIILDVSGGTDDKSVCMNDSTSNADSSTDATNIDTVSDNDSTGGNSSSDSIIVNRGVSCESMMTYTGNTVVGTTAIDNNPSLYNTLTEVDKFKTYDKNIQNNAEVNDDKQNAVMNNDGWDTHEWSSDTFSDD